VFTKLVPCLVSRRYVPKRNKKKIAETRVKGGEGGGKPNRPIGKEKVKRVKVVLTI